MYPHMSLNIRYIKKYYRCRS